MRTLSPTSVYEIQPEAEDAAAKRKSFKNMPIREPIIVIFSRYQAGYYQSREQYELRNADCFPRQDYL